MLRLDLWTPSMRCLVGVLLFIGFAPSAAGQDNPVLGGDGPPADGGDFAGASTSGRSMAGPRSSPFDPPDQSDRLFVADDGPGLDTGCTYRSGGPLRFEIPVSRYVGPTAGGVLADAAGLVASGVVSSTAQLRMPVFDVDSRAVRDDYAPEVDRIVFNGYDLGTLDGNNNQWNLNTFEVPIQVVRFPARGSGGPPTPAANTVEVYIDEANTAEVWCMGLDWASLEFGALSPVLLVHGIGNNPGFWDRMGFAGALRAGNVPVNGCASCPDPINSPGRISQAPASLPAQVAAAVATYGADSYHLVGHSKGGLDTRAFLGTTYTGTPTMLSLVTLSTPHDGTAVADLNYLYNLAVASGADRIAFEGFPLFTETAARISEQVRNGSGDFQLTTDEVDAFNRGNVGRLSRDIRYLAIGGDADKNGNGLLGPSETDDLLRELAAESSAPEWLTEFLDSASGGSLATTYYQILRDVQSVDLDYETRTVTLTQYPNPAPILLEVDVAVLTGDPTAGSEGNDVLVGLGSAFGAGSAYALLAQVRAYVGGAGRNHSTIADGDVATGAVIPWVIQVERAVGDLR